MEIWFTEHNVVCDTLLVDALTDNTNKHSELRLLHRYHETVDLAGWRQQRRCDQFETEKPLSDTAFFLFLFLHLPSFFLLQDRNKSPEPKYLTLSV